MNQSAQKVIATSGLVTLVIGTVNSLHKNNKLPSVRFLIGVGSAFFILSALAEAEAEVAQALAIAVTTTVLLGEGGGVLSYIGQHGETDTTKPSGFTPKETPIPPASDTDYGHGAVHRATSPISSDILAPQPGL